jgi:phosphoribosylpyrophosphate synthetase
MAAATATATAATTFAFADFNNESDAQTKNTPLQRRWNTNDPRNVTQVKRVMTKRPYLYNDMFVQSTLDNMKNNAVIASGSSHPALANEIVQYLGVELSPMECSTFSDGEIKIQIGKNVRGKDFFVIQSLCSTGNRSLNDSIIELLLTVSAARRASARSITAVIPYFAYARQSRKGSSKARTTIAAADLAKMLSSMGVDRILTVDLHSPEIVGKKPVCCVCCVCGAVMPVNELTCVHFWCPGCFPNHVNVTNVVPTPVAAAYFGEKEEELQQPVVVSPKSGGIFRAKQFMTTLKKFKPDVELVTFVKEKFDDGSTTRRLLGNTTSIPPVRHQLLSSWLCNGTCFNTWLLHLVFSFDLLKGMSRAKIAY